MTTPNRVRGADGAEAAPPICVRVDGAMGLLGIGKTKLYDLIAAGELETIHIGRRTLVLRTSIDALVERRRSAVRSHERFPAEEDPQREASRTASTP